MESETQKVFTSSKGVTLKLRPVSQFKLDTLRASKEEVPVPTYEATIAGGAKLNYPMDEEIAKNKGRMDEWNAYLAERNKAESEYSKKFLELLVWDGVDIEIPDIGSDWQRSMDYFGMKVPESQIERKLFYVYNELLGTQDDIGELVASIFESSQFSEEVVNQLRSSFRLALSRKPDQRVPKRQRRVESQSDLQPA